MDIDSPELKAWQVASGFTFTELATIQPEYEPPKPGFTDDLQIVMNAAWGLTAVMLQPSQYRGNDIYEVDIEAGRFWSATIRAKAEATEEQRSALVDYLLRRPNHRTIKEWRMFGKCFDLEHRHMGLVFSGPTRPNVKQRGYTDVVSGIVCLDCDQWVFHLSPASHNNFGELVDPTLVEELAATWFPPES